MNDYIKQFFEYEKTNPTKSSMAFFKIFLYYYHYGRVPTCKEAMGRFSNLTQPTYYRTTSQITAADLNHFNKKNK